MKGNIIMKIAIVDDDKNSIRNLSNVLIDSYGDIVESIDEFNSPGLFLSSDLAFDVLFLDIEMPRISGIELSKNHILEGANIVFVTSKESLVFEAYNTTNALGFIRKDNLQKDLAVIMDKLNDSNVGNNVMVIKKEKNIIKIPYKDILFIENQSNDIIIHTNHNNYTKRYKISDVERELADFNFIRCHIGFIVNLNHIDYIGEKDITLSNGEMIPLSRKRIKLVKEKFLRLNGA